MKINQTKQVQLEAKTLSLHCKVCDNFSASIHDQEGEEIGCQDDGYVPAFMPGDHFGDYIILDIDIDTGMITNWVVPSQDQIEAFINGDDEE